MGLLHYILGVNIVQEKSREIWIGQPNYTKDLLSKFKMEDCNSVDTPCDVGLKLLKANENETIFD